MHHRILSDGAGGLLERRVGYAPDAFAIFSVTIIVARFRRMPDTQLRMRKALVCQDEGFWFFEMWETQPLSS